MQGKGEPDRPEGSHGDVAGQAATWLARHQLGTIDEAAFQRWRDADVLHALAFCRALAAWEAAPSGAPMVDDAEVVAIRDETGAWPRAADTGSRRSFLRAASVAAAIGIFGTGAFATRAYAWSTAETVLGENRKVVLPDGSMAWLNTDSRLSWRFSGTERTLWIERGEVAFVLRDGPAVVVHGDDRSLALSSGRFNARLRSDSLDLLVLSGHARTREHGGEAASSVAAGQSLLVSPDDAIVRGASPAQVASTVAWQNGEILFQDTTLGMAIEEYNRFLARKIVIVDRDLAGIPVGGRFTSTDPTAFLDAVSTGLGIHVSRSQSAYLLTR